MIYLLEVQWLGQTWYLSSRPCEPVEGGVAIPHTGTLECDGFSEALTLGGGQQGPCKADMAFVLSGIDIQKMVLQGHQLNTMKGVLSLWSPERTYGQRVKLIQGKMKVSNIPEMGYAIEATLTQVIIENAESYPPATAATTAATWAGLPEDSDGAPYPFPIGNLGTYEDAAGTSANSSAYKIIMLDVTAGAEIGLVAGAAIGATTVSLFNDDIKASATFNVTTDTDLLGTLVSIVDFAGSAWVPDGTFDIFVGSLQGGIAKSHGEGTITGIGDAALHLLLMRYASNGPEQVDVGRWVAAMPFLNAWEVGFSVEAGDDPLAIIKSKLCPMCPALWLMPGPAGVRPVIMADTDASSALHLEVGRNCDEAPDAALLEVDLDPITSCTVSYAYSQRLSRPMASVTVDHTTDERAEAGYSREGSLAMALEIASCDRGTAALTGSEHIRMAWTRPHTLVVQVAARDALQADCELGVKVRHTNARRGISERPMYVQGRDFDADGNRAAVTLLGWW